MHLTNQNFNNYKKFFNFFSFRKRREKERGIRRRRYGLWSIRLKNFILILKLFICKNKIVLKFLFCSLTLIESLLLKLNLNQKKKKKRDLKLN